MINQGTTSPYCVTHPGKCWIIKVILHGYTDVSEVYGFRGHMCIGTVHVITIAL